MDYSKKTVSELKAICKGYHIKGFSGKTKKVLLEMIQKKQMVSDEVDEKEVAGGAGAGAGAGAGGDEKDVAGVAGGAGGDEKDEKDVTGGDEKDEKDKKDVTGTEKNISETILSAKSWRNTKTFKTIKDKETQIKYYKRMNSCEEVLQLVDLESKPFGSESEKIIQEIFGLGQRTCSENDGTWKGKKIEIKSARYWTGEDDCKWQHLEPDHDYEYALFALLDFQCWKVWGVKKSLLMGELRDKKIVTKQGKQGCWVKKSDILPYLTPIHSVSDLDAFISSQE